MAYTIRFLVGAVIGSIVGAIFFGLALLLNALFGIPQWNFLAALVSLPTALIVAALIFVAYLGAGGVSHIALPVAFLTSPVVAISLYLLSALLGGIIGVMYWLIPEGSSIVEIVSMVVFTLIGLGYLLRMPLQLGPPSDLQGCLTLLGLLLVNLLYTLLWSSIMAGAAVDHSFVLSWLSFLNFTISDVHRIYVGAPALMAIGLPSLTMGLLTLLYQPAQT